MQPWDLHHTYDLVERVFGRDQVALVKPCLRSVVDRQNFASYHFLETRRLLKSFKRKHLADKNLLVALHGARNPPARVPFEVLMIKAGAHATACVQAIHAISDILASGVYFATGLNLQQNNWGQSKSKFLVNGLSLLCPQLSLPQASMLIRRGGRLAKKVTSLLVSIFCAGQPCHVYPRRGSKKYSLPNRYQLS